VPFVPIGKTQPDAGADAGVLLERQDDEEIGKLGFHWRYLILGRKSDLVRCASVASSRKVT
jgi:hypothetical protein